MESLQYCLFPSTQAPYLHKGSPLENYVSLWIFRKSAVWLRMCILTIIIQLALCQTQHNTWQRSHYSASLIAPMLITVCRWRTNGQWKCSHLFLLAELLPKKYLHKVSADPCLLFQVSCVSTWTQSSKLTNVLNTKDDIGIAANNATDLTRNFWAVFKCIRQTVLKLTIEKCHFGVRQIEFLGRTIWTEGISPQARKIQNFRDKLRFPKWKKALQRYLGFVNYYKNYISRMAEKPYPFYKLLKTEVPIKFTSELKETFDSVNRALSDACQLALKQPIPGTQLVLITDAGFTTAGYGLMIEDNPDQKIQSKRKTYAPAAFGSKTFSPAQLKMSIYSKEISAKNMAFLEFEHILWEATKPKIVLTVNKSVTRFFQTKATTLALCNACDYVLQINFKIAHIAGSIKTAAEFHSRLELKVTEKIRLKIRENIQATPIEVTTSSSDVADEKQFFFTQAENNDESEEQTLERKEQSRQNAKQWAANEESPILKTSVKEFTKIDGDITLYSMNGIRANARIRVEQAVDFALKNMKFKIRPTIWWSINDDRLTVQKLQGKRRPHKS